MERASTIEELKRAKLACFPEDINALDHVLELIDEMLMTPEEIVIQAAIANELIGLHRRLQKHECDLSDAIVGASSHGYLEMAVILLRKMKDRESDNEATNDDDADQGVIAIHEVSATMRKAMRKATVVAAGAGHLPVVVSFLPKLVGSGEDTDVMHEMYKTTWQTIDEAAANGHLGVVTFAVDYATEWGFIDSYCASKGSDALTRAIGGGQDAVAMFLLQLSKPQWDMSRVFAEALRQEWTETTEWIYVLCQQEYGVDVIRFLHETGCILVGSITNAFRNAITRCTTGDANPSRETFEIVEFLGQQDCVPARVIRAAFKTAAKHNCLRLVKFLSGDSRLSSEVVRKTFTKAAFDGNVEIVECISASHEISSELTCEALLQAIKREYFELVEFLFKTPLPDSVKEKAFLKAVQLNKAGIVRLLCTITTWPSEVLRQALQRTRRPKLRRFLMKL